MNGQNSAIGLRPSRLFWRLSLSLCIVATLTHAHAKECDWISDYVKRSLPPNSMVTVKLPGQPLPNVIRDVFPTAPAKISAAIYSSEDAAGHETRHHSYAASAIRATQLPIEFSAPDDPPHIVVFLYKKGITPADNPRLFSQFNNVPHRGVHGNYDPIFDSMFIRLCWTSWTLTADAQLSQVTIFVPFNKDGSVDDSSQACIAKGALRAFGVGLAQDMAPQQDGTEKCEKCAEADMRMASILQENNTSDRVKISAPDMVRRLTNNQCGKN